MEQDPWSAVIVVFLVVVVVVVVIVLVEVVKVEVEAVVEVKVVALLIVEEVLLALVVGARPLVSRCPPGHRIGTHPAMCTYFIHTWPDLHNDNLACLRVYKFILLGEKIFFF